MEIIASELQDYLTSAYEIVDELPTPSSDTQDKFYIVEEEEEEEKLDKIDFDLEFSDEVTDYILGDYVPRVDTQKWGTDARNKHVYFPVTAGEKYIVEDLGSRNLCTYCFLTEYNGSEREGNISLVEGTEVYEVSKPNGYEIITIPEGCTMFVFSYNTYTDDINELRGKAYKYRSRHLNDYATKDYVRLNGGKIDVIKYNGTPLEIVDKAVDIPVPAPYDDTAVRELIAAMGERLVEMYYTKGEVDELIDNLQFGIIKKVDALPAVGENHIIYLVPKEAPATGFDEWIWVSDEEEYELIGDTNIDLSDYYTKSEVDAFMTELDNAIEQAERLNVELEGSVITVTNKEGVEKEIDLLDATNERVYINVTTNKEDQSVEGLVVNCFLNNDVDEPLQATTNANGQCYFDVPNNYHYRLVFPTIAGCDPITDVTHIAHASQRIVDVEYKETVIPTYGENVLIVLQEKHGENFVRVPNKVVTVTYNGRSTDYTTDAEGKIIDIIIPFNTQYTITYPKIEGYYIRGGAKYTFEYTADKSNRSCIMTYFSFQSGVFIVSDEGYSYNLQEWVDSGLPDSKAVAIKIATTDLQDNGGVFAVDIDFITNTGPSNLPTLQWANSEILFTSIPADGRASTSDFFYDGFTSSELIIAEGITRGVTTPAFNRAKQYTLTVGGETYNGFIGSRGQWIILWNLMAEINDILTTVRPDGQYRLNNYTVTKWNAGQVNAYLALQWSVGALQDSKIHNKAVFPFFKIN